MTDITFVVPRYGREIHGGAETGARSLAVGLAADGWDVQVLTTCALSALTWANQYPARTETEDGVAVHRFATARTRPVDFDAWSAPVLARPGAADRHTALEWIDRQGPDSPGLIDAVASVRDGVLALYPCLYQPAVRGAMVASAPTVLHPAAHPEPPLGLCVFDELFTSVDALAFHSRAEQRLIAERSAVSTVPQAVVGLPVPAPGDPLAAGAAEAAGLGEAAEGRLREAGPVGGPAEAAELGGAAEGRPAVIGTEESLRRRFDLGEGRIVLCLGRVDPGKGARALADAFGRGRFEGATLVLAGPGRGRPPSGGRVRSLGPVTDRDKWGLLAAADVLVQPSRLESFSLVVLEAWLAGTPVLVNGECPPLVEHCRAGGGGLWYCGEAEFRAALRRLLDDARARRRLAVAGRVYVTEAFSWPAVKRRYEALLSRIV